MGKVTEVRSLQSLCHFISFDCQLWTIPSRASCLFPQGILQNCMQASLKWKQFFCNARHLTSRIPIACQSQSHPIPNAVREGLPIFYSPQSIIVQFPHRTPPSLNLCKTTTRRRLQCHWWLMPRCAVVGALSTESPVWCGWWRLVVSRVILNASVLRLVSEEAESEIRCCEAAKDHECCEDLTHREY